MTNQKDKISELEHKLDALEKKYKASLSSESK